MPLPRQVATYLYRVTLMPTASAVPGFSPTERRCRPTLVRNSTQEAYLSLEVFGWLSIALVIFALWRPHMTIIGSTVFGFLFSCSSQIANIEGINITMAAKPLLKMLPYVFTIAVLIFTSLRNKRENQPPASLGMSYFREER